MALHVRYKLYRWISLLFPGKLQRELNKFKSFMGKVNTRQLIFLSLSFFERLPLLLISALDSSSNPRTKAWEQAPQPRSQDFSSPDHKGERREVLGTKAATTLYCDVKFIFTC